MNPTEQLTALHDGSAQVARPGRGHVLVTGPDARSFLQALVSADLDALEAGNGAPSLLLTPQGKLDVAFRLLVVESDVWLDCDPGFGAQLADSLHRFRIRVQADVIDRTDEFDMLSVIGSPDVVARAFDVDLASVHDHVARDDVRIVRTEHGVDVLGPPAAMHEWAARLADRGIPVVDPMVYDAWRIEQGIPLQPLDIDAKTIPQEATLELDAVSFTKGCFLGQELVCRIDSRGHVNRFLRRFTNIEGDWPEPGAEVVVDGKVVGALTSVAAAELPTGALGYVRREVEPPAAVELRSATGRTARAEIAALR
jgi:folate-binding protein YgfZ